jgi:hypothetical protein
VSRAKTVRAEAGAAPGRHGIWAVVLFMARFPG